MGMGKNRMWSPSGKEYDRYINPAGKITGMGKPGAMGKNIDVASIPSMTSGQKVKAKKPKGKPIVSISYGGGTGWSDAYFPGFKENFSRTLQGLDKAYGGSDKYSIQLVGGPNANADAKAYFNNLRKQRGNLKYYNSLSQKSYMNLLAASDVAVTAPGSTISELASTKGAKPKILAFAPTHKEGSHFKPNANFYKSHFGTLENLEIDRNRLVDPADVARKVNKLRSSENSTKSVAFGKKDVNRILNYAKKDLAKKVKTTNRLALGGAALLTVGSAALMTNKNKEKK